MIIKNSAFGNEWGKLDPAVKQRTARKKPIRDDVLSKQNSLNDFDILKIRQSMGGNTKDISKNIIIERDYAVPSNDHFVLIRTYRKKKISDNCLLYLHGGGFVGGSILSMENQCKAIADRSGNLVVSIEYRLAPETIFPGALDDVRNVIEWLVKSRNLLNYKKDKLYICGDSAGANLGVVAGALDKKHQIKKIISLYGALDFTDKQNTVYKWQYSNYQMCSSEKTLIHTRLNKFIGLNRLIQLVYVTPHNKINNPLISPVYLKDFSNLPPVVLIEAEFDYYLQSNKYFAKRLQKHQKKVDEILYKGLDHGFFDRLGHLPQAEDAVNLITKLTKES